MGHNQSQHIAPGGLAAVVQSWEEKQTNKACVRYYIPYCSAHIRGCCVRRISLAERRDTLGGVTEGKGYCFSFALKDIVSVLL